MAISKRLKNRSEALKFWTDEIPKGREVEVPIEGSLVKIWLNISSDGVVEKLFFKADLPPEKMAFVDILLEFSLGKDQKSLSGVLIREIENYCRDQNHIAAINDEVFLEDARKLLENVKNNVYNFSSRESEFDFDPKFGEFKNLRLVEKIKILERLFDQKIRPVLYKDGGNILLDEVDSEVITVRFEGTCGTCPSSETGTLDFIRQTLQKNLFDTNLKVNTVLKRYL